MAVHLRINEVADVMTTVRPLENAVAAYLTFHKVSAIDVNSIIVVPLFEAFTCHLTLVEKATYVDFSTVHLFETLTFDLIFDPLAFVLNTVSWLLVLAIAVELAFKERTSVHTSVDKRLLTFSVREIVDKLSGVDRSIAVAQGPMAILDTVFPLAPILSMIGPLADTEAIHLSVFPFPVVGPATFLAHKSSLARLESIFERSLINITIRPLSGSLPDRVPVAELADVRLTLTHDQLSVSFHLAVNPCTFVRLISIWLALVIGPCFRALTLRLSFHYLSLILRRIRPQQDSTPCDLALVALALKHNAIGQHFFRVEELLLRTVLLDSNSFLNERRKLFGRSLGSLWLLTQQSLVPFLLMCLCDIPLCVEVIFARLDQPLQGVLLSEVLIDLKSNIGRLNSSSLLTQGSQGLLGLIRCQTLVQVLHQVCVVDFIKVFGNDGLSPLLGCEGAFHPTTASYFGLQLDLLHGGVGLACGNRFSLFTTGVIICSGAC